MVKLQIDRQPLNQGKRIELYSKEIKPSPLWSLGSLELTTAGKHKLTVTVVGKNPQSSSYRFGLDEIQLVPIK
jgi:hypothetical protein